jgi:hypothetical protein
MATITFDGPTKRITIGYDGPITEVTAAELYSRWKDWVALGNAQYEPAFAESVGGNELGGGTALSGYYFINNNYGWKIIHSNYDYEIVISGDLYPSDPLSPFVTTTVAPHSVQFIFQRSAASYVTVGSGSSGPTAAQVAAAVWDRPMASHNVAGSFGKRIKELLPTLWGIK